MGKYKLFEINTTSGKEFGIGLFDDDGEMLAGKHHGSYKTKKGAEKKLKSLLDM